MTTSFYNGITGLKSFQRGIDIWGDNISNINTTGFKAKTPDYDTLFSDTLLSTLSSDKGFGSTVTTASLDMSQGSIVNSDNEFDMALAGEGYFSVKYKDQVLYTRDGSFTRDRDGYLVNNEGAYLLVASAKNIELKDGKYYVNRDIDTSNVIQNPKEPFFLPENLTMPGIATTEATLFANLKDDVPLITKKIANENVDLSAAYDNLAEPIQMQNNQDFYFSVGEPSIYKDGLITREICLEDDVKDGEDLVIDFSINGVNINLTVPDGSTKEEIQEALYKYITDPNNNIIQKLNDAGVSLSLENATLTLTSQEKLEILSNTSYIKSSLAEILRYNQDKTKENEFKTLGELLDLFQDEINKIYNNMEVGLRDGQIYIANHNEKEVAQIQILPTDHSNEKFMKNLGNLSNFVMPNSEVLSGKFYINSQTFGGYYFDKEGEKHDITYTFTKKSINGYNTIWEANIQTATSSITQDFIFNQDGKLIEPTTLTVDGMKLIFNLTSDLKIDLKSEFTQNGAPKGDLIKYDIEKDGRIIASFTNSTSATIGQIPIYHFINDQGLDRVMGNMFIQTSNSNDAFLYYDQDNNYIPGASVLSYALESSNVKMTEAMTQLIVTQKAFSAAAKTVTTSDQMIQKAIDMKR
jgi:flagellar hook protein FlgE